MSEEGKGVKARRERLGMTIQDLAKEAGVSRDTLSDLESGVKDFRRLTLNKVLRALERVEEEAGVGDAAPPGPERREFTFEVSTADGLRIVTSGHVEDADKLMRQVLGIIREGQDDDETPGRSLNNP